LKNPCLILLLLLAAACNPSLPEYIKKDIFSRENAGRRLVLQIDVTRFKTDRRGTKFWYRTLLQDSVMKVYSRDDSADVQEFSSGSFDPLSKVESY